MTNDTNPLVSVVVLSYDRPEYLPGLLDSVLSQTYKALEVVVVDNKSTRSDEIAGLVRARPPVRLVRNEGNSGYTGGMNRGIAEATGEYVYLTVDDALLENDCIERLVEHARAYPREGLLTGLILTFDRRTILSAGGEFALTPVYRRRNIGAGEKDVGQFDRPFEATCLDGAMVFGRLQYLRDLGGFREEFFMYSDSIELSARVLKAGGRIACVPQARAYIHSAPHGYTEEGISFHKMKNLYAMYLLHARWRVLPEFFLRYGVLTPIRSVRSNTKTAWPLVKAWGWLLLRTPSLVLERMRGA